MRAAGVRRRVGAFRGQPNLAGSELRRQAGRSNNGCDWRDCASKKQSLRGHRLLSVARKERQHDNGNEYEEGGG